MKRIFFILCVFSIFLTSVYAGDIYTCIDRNGNTVMTSSPQDGMRNCALKDSSEDEYQERQERRTIRREERNEASEIRREERYERRAEREKPKLDKICERNCQVTYNSCVSDCTRMGSRHNESSCRYTCDKPLDRCISGCYY